MQTCQRFCQVSLDCKWDEEPVLAQRILSAHRERLSSRTITAKYAAKRPALDTTSWWCKKDRISLELHGIVISTSHGGTNMVKHKLKLWRTESLAGSTKIKILADAPVSQCNQLLQNGTCPTHTVSGLRALPAQWQYDT
jgi:hypothetical protein